MRAVVVDGAQEFCHVQPTPAVSHCDLYLAGSHKWLGGYHPLGFAFYGRGRSRSRIDTILAEMVAASDLDDPLLQFASRLEAGMQRPLSETVNLASLFAAHGAAADAHRTRHALEARLGNSDAASAVASEAGWEPFRPSPELRSGILLIRARPGTLRNRDQDQLRVGLGEAGVAATVYGGGIVRLSMPAADWQPDELKLLRRALTLCA